MTTLTLQQRNILGPLTTTFTQPPECTYAVAMCRTCGVAWFAQTCAPTGVQDNPGCWPATSNGVPEPTPTLKGWGFYSPGLVCPKGYMSACTATAGGASGWPVQFAMEPGETAVGCCPTGYRCANGAAGETCIAQPMTTTMPTVTCQGGTSGDFGQLTVPNSLISGGPFLVFAPMFQINWRSTDRLPPNTTSVAIGSAGETNTQTSLTSAAVVATTSTRETETQGGPTSPAAPNPPKGLRVGDIVGIAISVTAAVVLIVVTALLIRRRKQAQRLTPPQHGDPVAVVSRISDPKSHELYVPQALPEMPGGLQHQVAELPAELQAAELPAGWNRGYKQGGAYTGV